MVRRLVLRGEFRGLPSPDPQRGFLLHVGCGRELCISLLYHLASCGEPVATKIIDRLPDIERDIQIEESARDEDG